MNSWSITFPDKYLIVSSIVQDVAFILGKHTLFEWAFLSHQSCGHGTSSIWDLEKKNQMIKTFTSESFTVMFLHRNSLKSWIFVHIYQIERCRALVLLISRFIISASWWDVGHRSKHLQINTHRHCNIATYILPSGHISHSCKNKYSQSFCELLKVKRCLL